MNRDKLGGMLEDVRICLDGVQTSDGIVARIRSKELELTYEESECMREKHPEKSYEEWVDIVHPEQSSEVLIPFSNSELWYRNRTVDESAFSSFCQSVSDTLHLHEGDLSLRNRLGLAATAAARKHECRVVCEGLGAVYEGVAELLPELELPPLDLITESNAEEVEARIRAMKEPLSGKIVGIPDLSFVARFYKGGVLLFEPRPSYLSCVRDGFRKELRLYLDEN